MHEKPLSAKVIESVFRFGKYYPNHAKNVVGETGWLAIQIMGGWPQFCDLVASSPIYESRLREICDALTGINHEPISYQEQVYQ